MSFMDEIKKLARPYDDDSALIDDDMDMDDGLDEQPVFTRPATAQQPQAQSAPAPASPDPINMGGLNMNAGMGGAVEAPRPSVNNISYGGLGSDIAKYRVVLVQPEKFDCATTIANHIRQGDAVILNCEETDRDVARRVVDFLSGCAYALDGNIRKAAADVYILVPRDVGVDNAIDGGDSE